MRPGALTQAARSAEGRREPVQPRARTPRSGRPPRRVSGPVRGKASAPSAPRIVMAARAAAIALPLTPPLRWKREPAKPPIRRDRPTRRAAQPERAAQPPASLARRAGAWAVGLPGHLWLDRVVRGRAWIPLLGLLLAGIVAAQVEILKLGATMGRALEQTTTLTTQNEALRGTVAQLADAQRIERLASNLGLVLPPPGAVGYLAAQPGGDVSGALGNIHAPDAAAFVTMPAKNGGMVTGPGTSTLPPPPGTPAPPPPASTASTTAATSTGATSTGATSTASQTPTPQVTPAAQATPTSQATTTPAQSTATTTPAQSTPTQQSGGGPATGAAAIGPSQPSGGG